MKKEKSPFQTLRVCCSFAMALRGVGKEAEPHSPSQRIPDELFLTRTKRSALPSTTQGMRGGIQSLEHLQTPKLLKTHPFASAANNTELTEAATATQESTGRMDWAVSRPAQRRDGIHLSDTCNSAKQLRSSQKSAFSCLRNREPRGAALGKALDSTKVKLCWREKPELIPSSAL